MIYDSESSYQFTDTPMGICFSYFAPPYADVSAYVSTKRLAQINDIEESKITWHIFRANCDRFRKRDVLFDELFAQKLYSENHDLGSDISITNGLQEYSDRALSAAIRGNGFANYVYSRSMPPHGHLAAYHYKVQHPQAKWYAEISDPLSRGTDSQIKPIIGEEYERIEQLIYTHADMIIFTNANQQEFMLSYSSSPELNGVIKAKSIISSHPIMDVSYTTIVPSEYIVTTSSINIGYFGAFYSGLRGHTELLKFLMNPNITLHLFVTGYYDGNDTVKSISESAIASGYDTSRLKINASVFYFEMLNIASKMDYLYLEDSEFPGPINPYLPSKYADYVTATQNTSGKIIARIQPNSSLSKLVSSKLIGVDAMSPEFIEGLGKPC